MTSTFELSQQNIQHLASLFDSSTDESRLGNLFEQLETIQNFHGFRLALLTIISTPTFSSSIRQFAASCFKNSLHSWWKRPSSQSTLSQQQQNQQQQQIQHDDKESERQKIKSLLLTIIMTEQDDVIPTILSDSMALIAQHDFPLLWPEFGQIIFNTYLSTTVLPTINPQTNTITSLSFNINQQQTQDKIISLTLRCFDILNLTVQTWNGRADTTNAFAQALVIPFLPISYQYWVLYAGLLAQLTPQAATSITNPLYCQTIIIVLRIVREITQFLSKCIQLHPTTILNLENGQLADNIFQSFGQCIGTFQEHINTLPSHQNTITIRNQLNAIRGYCSTCISDCISVSPILFRKYLQPYTTLFIQIIQNRAQQRQQELELLALQHASDEIGIGLDQEDEDDLTIKGQDPCIINAFNFLTKIISNPSYAPSSTIATSTHTNALLSLQARQTGLESTMEAVQIAQTLMNDQWCLSLGELIITKYLTLLRYDIDQICNRGEEYYFTYQSYANDNNERSAAIYCYQKLYCRNQQLMTTQIQSLLSNTSTMIPILIDLPYNNPLHHQANTDPNFSKKDYILKSWQVDSILYAFHSIISATNELCTQFDFISIATTIMTTYNNFITNMTNPQHQPTQLNSLACIGEGILNTIVFESHPTTFLRLLACFTITNELTSYLDQTQLYSLWDTFIPFLLIDNHFIKLSTSKMIQTFADALAITSSCDDDNDDEFNTNNNNDTNDISTIHTNSITTSTLINPQQQQTAIRIIQTTTRTLFEYAISTTEETESKGNYLLAVKYCVQSLSLNELLPLLSTIIPSLITLWQNHSPTYDITPDDTISSQIIMIIDRIIYGLGSLSFILNHIILTILRDGIQQEQGPIFDSSYQLWETYLKNLPYLTNDMLTLFQSWINTTKEYPDLFSELLSPVLNSYLHLSLNSNQIMVESISDIQILPTQISSIQTTISQSLPIQVQQLLQPSLSNPSDSHLFALYGNPLLESLLTVLSYNPISTQTELLNSLDLLLRCVGSTILFNNDIFRNILNKISSTLLPELIFDIRLTGLTPQMPQTSTLYIPPTTKQQLLYDIYGQQQSSTQNNNEIPPSILHLMFGLFSRLLIECPEQMILYLSTISLPQLTTTQSYLSTPLCLFFSAGIHYCNEAQMPESSLRKSFTLGLLQCWAIYHYCYTQLTSTTTTSNNLTPQLQQYYQSFVNMMDNNEYILLLFITILTEAVEDAVPELRYHIRPLSPIQLTLPQYLKPDSMHIRRVTILCNHDITLVTEISTVIKSTLNLCKQTKGDGYLQAMLKSLPLDLLLAVDLRQ